MSNQSEQYQSFRDSISTVDKRGERVWLFPKKPKGKYYNARIWISILLFSFLFTGPFIRIAGEPFLLFNIIERKFVLFGKIFWPHDFYLFVIATLTFIVFIIVFSVVYGRLFCGWICPQTIFMEMLFRKIEYWLEGDWKKQQLLIKTPWNIEKIWKKGIKHIIFFIISFIIANVFLAYIIGSEELITIIKDPPEKHLMGLLIITGFSFVFYWIFAFFREQVCIVVCPYGRLQGVLLDRDSVVVAYDYKRGEKREKFRKGANRSNAEKGDCIDCKQCVYVCPTGIDIRNGTQLECINCTACIDACDFIMEKIGQPKGLIRYDSEEGIANQKKFKFTTRMFAYSVLLSVLLGILGFLLTTRSDVETSILRTPGMLYQEKGENKISNLFNYKIINKTNKNINLNFKLENIDGEIQLIGNMLEVKRQGISKGALFIILDKNNIEHIKTEIEIGVYSDGKKIESVKTNFMGPGK